MHKRVVIRTILVGTEAFNSSDGAALFRIEALVKTLVFVVLVAVAAPVAANTYLVGSTRQYQNLNAVAGLLNPGDLVLVDGNQTYPSALLTRSGNSGQPITIRGVRINGPAIRRRHVRSADRSTSARTKRFRT